MANFLYRAKTDKGKDTQGFIEATDQKQALSILKEKGLIALERLMGMILITIAIQMSISGIEQLIR